MYKFKAAGISINPALNNIEKAICIGLFLIPFFVPGIMGILLLVSALSAIYLFDYAHTRETEEPAGGKRIPFLLIINIFMSFLLTVIDLMGFLDYGLQVHGITFIPNYVVIYYYIIPVIWIILQKKKKGITAWFTVNRITALYSLAVCFPIIIFNITRVIINPGFIFTYDQLFQNIFQSLITASLAEELFFRGYLYPEFKRFFKINTAQILTAVLFAVWHLGLFVNLYNGFSLLPLVNLLSIFLLGMVTAKLTEKTGSLIPAILFHALINGALENTLLLIKKAFFNL